MRTAGTGSGRQRQPQLRGRRHQQRRRRLPRRSARSCLEHGGNNRWLFRVVKALRERDKRWGLNWKRANVGDMSQDVITFNWGTDPDEGTFKLRAWDIIGGHCGSRPGRAVLGDHQPEAAELQLRRPVDAAAVHPGRQRAVGCSAAKAIARADRSAGPPASCTRDDVLDLDLAGLRLARGGLVRRGHRADGGGVPRLPARRAVHRRAQLAPGHQRRHRPDLDRRADRLLLSGGELGRPGRTDRPRVPAAPLADRPGVARHRRERRRRAARAGRVLGGHGVAASTASARVCSAPRPAGPRRSCSPCRPPSSTSAGRRSPTRRCCASRSPRCSAMSATRRPASRWMALGGAVSLALAGLVKIPAILVLAPIAVVGWLRHGWRLWRDAWFVAAPLAALGRDRAVVPARRPDLPGDRADPGDLPALGHLSRRHRASGPARSRPCRTGPGPSSSPGTRPRSC